MLKRLLAIILLIAATIGYSVYQKKSLESQLVTSEKGETILAKLPESFFETLDGQKVELNSFYPNDLLVVHYWGTWCAPCEAELPALLQLTKRMENRGGVKFLLVAVDDELIKVKKHLKGISWGPNVTWLIDNQKIHRDLFGTTRVPETYVFSSDKTTLRKFTGPQEWNKDMFFQTFDDLFLISTRKL